MNTPEFLRMRLAGALALAVATVAAGASLAETGDDTESRIDKLIAKMTLAEKAGQMSLRNWMDLPSEIKLPEGMEIPEIGASPKNLEKFHRAVRAGRIGGFLNIPRNSHFPDAFDELQRIAVEESRLGIPLIFGHDVIHGYKTIVPIPLGQAASFDDSLVERGARIAAIEATSAGVNWTFAPMVDVSRDPRWGRIAESYGEDTLLNARLGAATVRGFHGDGLGGPNSLAACPKHYVAYGAAVGGRDYTPAIVPERLLRDVYLPPFKATVDAGAMTIMSSYTEINGVSATGNRFTLTDVLRGEWGFEGFVVSDWDSVQMMIKLGSAKDPADAAEQGVEAGTDFEMGGDSYERHLPALVESGRVQMATVDEAVRRILRAKMAMGLFERPYKDASRMADTLSAEHLDVALQAARASFVLLKNKGGLLPVSKEQKVAVIGPLAEVPYTQLGTWVYEGDEKDSRTLLPALQDYLGGDDRFVYAQGLPFSRSKDTAGFDEAIEAAKSSDIILFFGGEESILSGEAHSRGDISLPGAQQELFHKLAELGKPIALIILAGRPISLEGILDKADAVMMAWHPGTMAGPALVEVLYGEHSPAGHLPVTWPKSSGQVPIYYNHKNPGMPATDGNYTRIDDINPKTKFQHALGNSSNYIDYGHLPEFPFGHGLSYTRFEYSDLALNKKTYGMDDTIEATVKVKNTGKVASKDVVQLYIRDLVGSVTRPVAQLKAYSVAEVPAGGEVTVSLSLPVADLAFTDIDMEHVVEPGKFELWVGQHSADKSQLTSFEVK